ncbi:Uncharacterised protein (plasmid) [Legionella adelaidensis]|uniref:Tetratricopeptide repeat protein n=1 Tax=Legionella adelaidensis TaxID=45056 RepID=A0A0W0R206_9GAMM|nr:hypothetical protein [Legionella adelaidensis]KTC65001.1 hypothetical protein Lade_1681 [Legionella adelaidensis]VEH85319.1 Uncharacterised protein [Legionella adelaidensis]
MNLELLKQLLPKICAGDEQAYLTCFNSLCDEPFPEECHAYLENYPKTVELTEEQLLNFRALYGLSLLFGLSERRYEAAQALDLLHRQKGLGCHWVLAKIYKDRLTFREKNLCEAISYFEPLIALNHAPSMYGLARFLLSGDETQGVAIDRPLALLLLKQAEYLEPGITECLDIEIKSKLSYEESTSVEFEYQLYVLKICSKPLEVQQLIDQLIQHIESQKNEVDRSLLIDLLRMTRLVLQTPSRENIEKYKQYSDQLPTSATMKIIAGLMTALGVALLALATTAGIGTGAALIACGAGFFMNRKTAIATDIQNVANALTMEM